MRKISRIFVHCTAGSQRQTIADLKAEFQRKGWHAPGYHFVVSADGTVTQLLPIEKVANGVQGYNGHSIHIAWMGGIDSKCHAIDNRTPEQKAALRELVAKFHYRFPDAEVMGHREIWGESPRNWKKMCPCFNVKSEYKDL